MVWSYMRTSARIISADIIPSKGTGVYPMLRETAVSWSKARVSERNEQPALCTHSCKHDAHIAQAMAKLIILWLCSLFYCSIYNTVDNLLLAYDIENQNRQQSQQVRCKCQVIIGSEL